MRRALTIVAALALAAGLANSYAHAQTGGDDPPPGTLPYVVGIHTEPRVPCEKTPTSLVLLGEFRDGCGTVVDTSMSGSGGLSVTIKVAAGPDTACSLAIKPWRVEFPLGFLRAGHHRFLITLTVIDRDPDGKGFVRRTYQAVHEFDVSPACVVPPSDSLPYVSFIHIGSARVACTPIICEGDSILVQVGGEFPDDCFFLRGIEVIEVVYAGIRPGPPTVRIIVDQNCVRRVCNQRPVPWSGSVTLPPLPASDLPSDYQLVVELARVRCSDYPPGDLFSTHVPFYVRPDCPPQKPCLTASWDVPGNVSACNATIAPGEPAVLTFRVAPSAALAALQGEFRLDPPGLTITKLEAIGPAAKMLLNWNATRTGAQFVLFALEGAPIPPALNESYPPGSEVLRVTLEQPVNQPTADHTRVHPERLLGSDKEGAAIEYCEPFPCLALYPPPPRLMSPIALVCAREECDFNSDGVADVRDLVRMVRCLRAEGPCPGDVDTRFDCDGDHTFALPDVICCARHILQRPPCPDCPPNPGTPRPEPNVRLTFGSPVSNGTDVSLPLRIHGADRLGAAMLTLAAPLDRYALKGIEGPAGNGWITLHEEREGKLILGILSGGGGGDVIDLTLRLALDPGATPGGEVAAIAGEFSGGDGELLAVNLGTPRGGLPGPPRIALSSSRPNPFSIETRFTIELTEAAHAVVGIYDLRGRVVARLLDEALPSGPRELTWNGRGDDGKRAPNGVYFYRVEANGRTIARKLIVMRED